MTSGAEQDENKLCKDESASFKACGTRASVMSTSSPLLCYPVSHTQAAVWYFHFTGALGISLFVSVNSGRRRNAAICGCQEREHLWFYATGEILTN